MREDLPEYKSRSDWRALPETHKELASLYVKKIELVARKNEILQVCVNETLKCNKHLIFIYFL